MCYKPVVPVKRSHTDHTHKSLLAGFHAIQNAVVSENFLFYSCVHVMPNMLVSITSELETCSA